MTLFILVWQCTVINTTTSYLYIGVNANRKLAQKQAMQRCELDYFPGEGDPLDSCFPERCKQIEAPIAPAS